MAKCAEVAYANYNTIVNDLKESGLVYGNSMSEYAKMDNTLSRSRLGIGWSSNLAQLALSYYFTKLDKGESDTEETRQLYDIFVILSVVAQCIIDSSKREYEIDGSEEIVRIQNLKCMQYVRYVDDGTGKLKKRKYDFPIFMKYTREPSHTKNGDTLPYDIVKKNKDKLTQRINPDFVCPMNWLVDCLGSNEIKSQSHKKINPTEDYFVRCDGEVNHYKRSKVMEMIIDYDNYVKLNAGSDNEAEGIVGDFTTKTEEVVNNITSLKLGQKTVNRIVETALGLGSNTGVHKEKQGVSKKYTRKLLNILYRSNHDYFMNCFVKSSDFSVGV